MPVTGALSSSAGVSDLARPVDVSISWLSNIHYSQCLLISMPGNLALESEYGMLDEWDILQAIQCLASN